MTPIKAFNLPTPKSLPSVIPATLQRLNWKVAGCFAAGLIIVLGYAAMKISQSLYLRNAKNKLAEGIDVAPEEYIGLSLDKNDLIALHQFYQSNGILSHEKKLIVIKDFASLELGDLSLSKEMTMPKDPNDQDGEGECITRLVTLSDVIDDVINRINQQIKDAPSSKTVRHKRVIGFNIFGNVILGRYYRWGLTGTSQSEAEIAENSMLLKILKALEIKGYIFRLASTRAAGGYYIQA